VVTETSSRSITNNMSGATLTLSNTLGLSSTAATNTLTVTGTGNTTISAVIANNGTGGTASSGNLIKNGAGVLTLSGVNTYSGATTISAGTLALAGTGSIANSSPITIAGGATFDVSGHTGTVTLGNSQTLNGTGTAASGTIKAGANSGLTLGATSPLTLAYANGVPTLNVTGGALTLQSGNPVTVSTTSALPHGDYVLISSSAGGSVAGTAPTSLTVTGSGLGPNTMATLQITGGQLILHVVSTLPYVSVKDASLPEPSSGSRDMVFTVSLAVPAPSPVSVNFTTADEPPAAGKAVSGSDYVATSGTVSFATGERVKTINVPILADADNTEIDETFLVNLSNPSGVFIVDGQAIGTITVANPAGTLIISELRTSGPNGDDDDFVEIYNNTGSPLTVAASDASSGYGLYKMGADCTATPVLVGTIPNGTIIPSRGHYLFVGSTYSLGNYGGTGAAAGDLTMTSNIENDRNVAIFSTSDINNISTITRLDAVGFGSNIGGVCDLLREPSNLPAVAGATAEYSFFRKGKTSQDTNDNAADFRYADTDGPATITVSATEQLGAPGPENLNSPIGGPVNTGLSAFKLDSSQAISAAPNYVRDNTPGDPNTSSFGTLSIRRRLTNNIGVPVTRLRVRIYSITTSPPAGGQADLRALTSSDIMNVSVNDAASCSPNPAPCNVTVLGTTLEEPPTQSSGGGFNATFTVTLGTPLADNGSALVQFLFGVETEGAFNLAMVVEALPGGGGEAITAFGSTINGPTAANGSISGQILDADGNPLPGTVINLNGTQNRKMITDADGFYLFDKVETTGFYTVTPTRVNYAFNPGSSSFSQLGNNTEATFTGIPAGGFVNSLDTPEYFVRQHYLDFLGREPDEAGFNFWSDQILECGGDPGCTERRTVNVSAAYFQSIEFQRTGGLVDRLYRASYGRNPRYSEFMPDRDAITIGVVVGLSGWERQLAANEKSFVDAWVTRPAFEAAYSSLSNAEYVDRLLSNTGVRFAQAERDSLVSSLRGGAVSRADVLQQIAASESFAKARFNEAFVLMEYFGYLRRDPDEEGYRYWLNKLNQFHGNFERAEMVKAFISATEYRARFQR
jgi:autotransporter-associated beta strand protein